MKKVISIIIALVLVMSSGMVFASNGKSSYGNGKINNKNYFKADYSKEREKLKELLKRYHDDKGERADIIGSILDLKNKYADDTTSIFINGVEYTSDEGTAIKYGNFELPTKPITEGLGAKVNWNSKTKTVTITKGNITIVMKLDKKTVAINGVEAKSDILKNAKKGRVIELIEFIARVIGYQADMDEDSNSVIVDEDDKISINDSVIGNGLNQFDYKGKWIYASMNNAFLDDVHYSTSKNSYFTVKFTGTQIKLYGSKSTGYGIAAVSIDGGTERNVDLYSAKSSNGVLLYTSPKLSNGEHTLKVRVTGTKNKKARNYPVAVDRVEVIQNGNALQNDNLAVNKNVLSDSAQTGNPTGNGNDGSLSTRWCAADDSANHWWTVDLGSSYSISGSQVVWEKDGKVYKYKVEVSADNINWTVKADKTGNTSTQQTQTDSYTADAVRFVRITVTGLEKDSWASFYEFKVFGRVMDTQAPTTPSALIATAAAATEVALNWNASTDNVGVAGYKVFRNGTQVGTVASGTSYRDKGLYAGTQYVYTVSAYDAAGNDSGQCEAASVIIPAGGNGTGLTGTYFNNRDLTDTRLSRIDSTVDFSWSNNSPDSSIGADTFSVRWTGQVQPLYSETYTFYTVSDDGVRLWVNGQKIIDKWSDQNSCENYGTITLAAGQKYDIKLEYYENLGEASVKLLWSSPSQPKQIIPGSQLYPVETDTQAPAVPSGLAAVPVSSSKINISWSASADNVGVAGYKIYRDGIQIGTVTNGTVYEDTGLTANSAHIYTVSAFDAAGNSSVQCSPVTAATLQQDNTNIALAKTAASDSQEALNIAAKGNDGNSDTRWCAADSGLNHWWKVDLGQLYSITGSEVTWEKNNRIYKYKVEVSQDDVNWTLALDKTNNTSTLQTQADSFTANSVRYVRITVTGVEADCWASFSELKVFGF